jgi:TIR domain-containing protein
VKNNFEFDVFLSHNSADKRRVRILAEKLRSAGLKVWFDEWIIKPGDDICLCIEQGLEAARCLVLCMSSAAFQSDWVGLERSTAIFRDPANSQRRFIPLLLDKCEIPDTIRRYKYIDFTENSDLAIRRVVEVCRRDVQDLSQPETRSATSDVLIDFSHGQDRWHGFYRKGYYIFGDIDFQPVDRGTIIGSKLFDDANVLLLSIPNGTELHTSEINFLDDWVSLKGRGLFLMGFYLGDVHHRTNLNTLANRFHFSFGQNLLMPKGATSDRQCNHQAFRVNEEEHALAVKVRVGKHQHPIVNSIRQLGFLSACSLENITFEPSLIIQTPVVSVMQPLARKNDDGYIVKILGWRESTRMRLPIFAAWKHGRGRVAACGTWKICCESYGDNHHFVQHVIEWLG